MTATDIPHDKAWRWLSLGVFLLALGLRLAFNGNGGFWLDEAMQMRAALRDSLREVWLAIPPDKPPLSYWQLHLMAKASMDEFWLRLPSAIFGALCAMLTMQLAPHPHRRNWPAAILAGLLMAVAPLGVRLSHEILPYTEGLAFVLLAILGARHWLMTNHWRWLVACWAGSSLALMSVYTMMAPVFLMGFFFAGGALWQLIGNMRLRRHDEGSTVQRVRLSRWLLGAVAVVFSVLATLPLWLRLLEASGSSAPWAAPEINVRLVLQMASGLLQLSGTNPLLWLVCMIAAGSIVTIFVRFRSEPEKLVYPYWLIGGLLILGVAAVLQNHWIADRYLLIVLPPLMLILADGWTRFIGLLSRWFLLKPAVARMALLLPLIPCLIMLDNVVNQKTNFKRFTHNMATRAGDGDLIFFQHAFDQYVYDYYRDCRWPAAPPASCYQTGNRWQINSKAGPLIDKARRIIVPSLIYDGYDVDPVVRKVFIGPSWMTRQPELIRYRIISPGELIVELTSPSASDG